MDGVLPAHGNGHQPLADGQVATVQDFLMVEDAGDHPQPVLRSTEAL